MSVPNKNTRQCEDSVRCICTQNAKNAFSQCIEWECHWRATNKLVTALMRMHNNNNKKTETTSQLSQNVHYLFTRKKCNNGREKERASAETKASANCIENSWSYWDMFLLNKNLIIDILLTQKQQQARPLNLNSHANPNVVPAAWIVKGLNKWRKARVPYPFRPLPNF